MAILNQKDKAVQFRQLHSGPNILVLPNAWDAASARIFEQAGFAAVATTSSGVAASLGYPDGQRISQDMLVENVAYMTRVVECPITVDIEAGFGGSMEEVLQTIRAIIAAGAVGINIEDSTKGQERADRCFLAAVRRSPRALRASCTAHERVPAGRGGLPFSDWSERG